MQPRALMVRLEKVLGTPLDQRAKRDLWKAARTEYFELHHPELARLLGAKDLGSYQVHHLCPMEYAHLFPRLDINGAANLAGVHADVHASINAIWGSMRGVSARMRPQDVERVMEIVNRHYRRWFDKVFDPNDIPALVTAQKTALAELAELRALLAL